MQRRRPKRPPRPPCPPPSRQPSTLAPTPTVASDAPHPSNTPAPPRVSVAPASATAGTYRDRHHRAQDGTGFLPPSQHRRGRRPQNCGDYPRQADAIATDRPAGPRKRLCGPRTRTLETVVVEAAISAKSGPVAQLRWRSSSLAHGPLDRELIREPNPPARRARSARRGRRRRPRLPPGLSPRRARHRR